MIYIVTDGEYSDYHIEGVFLNKEKAYKYAELNDCIVEEYEPMDDAEIIVGQKVTVDYRVKESGTIFQLTPSRRATSERSRHNEDWRQEMRNQAIL